MSLHLYHGTAIENLAKVTEMQLPVNVAPYIPSKQLIKAVQLAQILGRPLLVKGEPGCGKSKLAEAVAVEIHGKDFLNNYFEWNIKSTSKAKDGLYSIDYLQRLSDANIEKKDEKSLGIELKKIKENIYEEHGTYIDLGEIGKAFMASRLNPSKPPVILIDEIDKADIDFPNDLLFELDRMEFDIPEIRNPDTQVIISANPANKPVIIITSNDEKPLPPAFLRRCLFFYIDFKDIKLEDIILSRFPDLKKRELARPAVEAFQGWRDKIHSEGSSLKNISTSELLDWIYLIDRDKGITQIDPQKPLFPEVLLKDIESIKLFTES
ncbi:MoxR family ATPase [Pedobacter miscanthi]|uniref:AAA family ATPase n=1 Tax=Pedobacter miscanthi TaxID=2259170 RepID=UPI00292D8FBE|nr:MoxR family ATPase [Pedobacter miscanthi]